MAFEDWKFLGNTENFNQSESRAFGGERSLRMENGYQGDGNMVVLGKSIDDAPTEGKIETHVLNTGGRGTFGVTFRWQDENNFYTIDSEDFVTKYENENIGLYREVEGDGTTVDRIGMQQSLSGDQNQWFQFRTSIFISKGELHVRPEFRPSADLGWKRFNEDEDLIDPNPDLEQGGGLGLNFENHSKVDGSSTSLYIDNTRLYYSK